MSSGLSAGFLLDRQWHWLRGEMEQSKRPALLAVARILRDAEVPYAVIGGLAVQVHQREPRTTLDIDLAVRSRDQIPGEALRAAGFALDGVFEHSENWRASDGTPVQFTDDPTLAEAIGRADVIALEDVELRVIRAIDLLHEKLRSGNDPGRRRSKRLRDLADAQALVEENPAFESELTSIEREILRHLPQ